jgi:hypothetical protein
MDKNVKNLLDWLEDEKGDIANLWGMEDTIIEPNTAKDTEGVSDAETLAKIFNPEQLRFIQILVKNVVAAIKFHESFEEAHIDIRELIKTSDAKLRNHRHNLDQTYSAKFSTCTEEFLIKMSIIDNGYNVYLHIWHVGSVEEFTQPQYEDLAKRDGFNDLKEMTEWFHKTHGEMMQECFQVIRWDKLVENHHFTQTVILNCEIKDQKGVKEI